MGSLGEGSNALKTLREAASRHYAGQVSQQHVDLTIVDLGGVSWSGLAKSCFVVGMGGQPKSAYLELENQPGISVVHCKSMLPLALRFVPAYRGAVKIADPRELRSVFELLSGQTMAAVYIFDQALERRFVELIRSDDSEGSLAAVVVADPGYLVYIVDTDVDSSATPCWEFLSFGPEGPWSELFVCRSPSS